LLGVEEILKVDAQLVGGLVADGPEAPGLGEFAGVEQADGDVTVSGVDG